MLMIMIHSNPVLGYSETIYIVLFKNTFQPTGEGVGSYILACVYTLQPPLSYVPENENFTENRKEKLTKQLLRPTVPRLPLSLSERSSPFMIYFSIVIVLMEKGDFLTFNKLWLFHRCEAYVKC